MERRYEGPVPSGLALPSQTQGQMGLEGKNQHAETGMHQMTQESHGLSVTAHGG